MRGKFHRLATAGDVVAGAPKMQIFGVRNGVDLIVDLVQEKTHDYAEQVRLLSVAVSVDEPDYPSGRNPR